MSSGCETRVVRSDADSTGTAPTPACVTDSQCEDSNPCTTDECVGGACAHAGQEGVECATASGCTQGTCSAAGKCVAAPVAGRACDDLDPCTMNDVCDASGKCVGGGAADGAPCNDQNPCTENDQCTAEATCGPGTPTPGASCSDQDACTEGEQCNAEGQCAGGAPVTVEEKPCHQCACYPSTGVECTPTLEGACACPNLWGRIRYVDSFADIKVQLVDSFPDFEVRLTGTSTADEAGEWQVVDSFADINVQLVESFPDVKVRIVDGTPDPCP